MNAVTFIRDYARMCMSYDTCDDCPLYSGRCMEITDLKHIETNDIHRIVNTVDEWSKGHPVKTRLMDFLEKYPNAQINEDGVPFACAESLGYLKSKNCDSYDSCEKCWNTLLED